MTIFHQSGEAGLIRTTCMDRSGEEATRYFQHLAVEHGESSITFNSTMVTV